MSDLFPIKLDLRTDLAKVRNGVAAQDGSCRYTAPCAIGAMMSPDQRLALQNKGNDHDPLKTLVDDKHLIAIAWDQFDDAEVLQAAYDTFDPSYFNDTLTRLELKYGVE